MGVACQHCGNTGDYVLKKEKVRYHGVYEGISYDFVQEEKRPYCKQCGEYIVIPEIEKRLNDAANRCIREDTDIVLQEDLNTFMENYNVKYGFLSILLDIAEEDLKRYFEKEEMPTSEDSEKLKRLIKPEHLIFLLEGRKLLFYGSYNQYQSDYEELLALCKSHTYKGV